MKFLPILLLGLIVILSLFLKIYTTDFNEPVFIDGAEYNQFAWNLAHGIRPLPVIHNIGFSLVLSPIFLLIQNESSTEIIQQIITISISTITLPIFYKLARRLFSWQYSLLATSFIAFEPHLIQNATFGITEPQYLFLFVISLYLLTSKKPLFQYVSFLTAGLATITRFEGFILFAVMMIIYYYQNKRTIRNVAKILPFLLIFFVPIIVSTSFNLDYGTRENVITAKINHDALFANTIITQHSFEHKTLNSVLHLVWSLYPMFIIFVPMGLYFLCKNKPINPILAITVLAMLSISGLFAYLRAYDVRYFIPLYPALALLSAYGIQCIYKTRIIQKAITSYFNNESETLTFATAFIAMILLSLYIAFTPAVSAENIHVNLNSTIIVYPTFTLAAYDSNGFYSYYKGLCDYKCLTINDRFSDINQIKYNAYGLDTIHSLKVPMISDEILDSNPEILSKYSTVIILHNEYVTQNEFDAITKHPHVIYLYPNALYALVKRTDYNTISLIRGHNYPSHDISNGFGWKLDNSPQEYNTNCKSTSPLFTNVTNGYMLNCYPQTFINTQALWSMVEKLAKN